jgi:hypothetical protein
MSSPTNSSSRRSIQGSGICFSHVARSRSAITSRASINSGRTSFRDSDIAAGSTLKRSAVSRTLSCR